MAITANAIWEVRATAGADTNGGGFDPSLTLAITDLAATSATGASPVVSSATYNFVAGDVNTYLFVQAGTNWIKGWYKIASVASNQATLDASVGNVLLYTSGTINPTGVNTVAGCATTASPTGGTGTVDYTQQNGTKVAVTDAVTNNTTTVTSATAAFSQAMVGSAVYLSGTGTTTGRYFMTGYTSATSITVDRNTGSTGGTGVTLKIGGALATCNEVASARGVVANNTIWIKNTGTDSEASTVTWTGGASGGWMAIYGYNALRRDLDNVTSFANHPLIQVNNASVQLINCTNGFLDVANLILDAGSGGTKGSRAINVSGGPARITNCKLSGAWTSNAAALSFLGQGCVMRRCYVTGAGSGASAAIRFSNTGRIADCTITGNSTVGVNVNVTNMVVIERCIIANNSGASSDGILIITGAQCCAIRDCTIDNNGRDGIRFAGGADGCTVLNNMLTNNVGWGINGTSQLATTLEDYNAFFNNTLGTVTGILPVGANDVTLTASPYNNAGAGDYSLNGTAGAGTAAKGAGYPGIFPNATTTGAIDIGAAQHASGACPPPVVVTIGPQYLDS